MAASTLREKIGQLLLVGFRGAVPAECDVIVRDIREHHVGSVILFDQDMTGPLRQGSGGQGGTIDRDRKSTRLNSSHQIISYAVFCLKKKTTNPMNLPSW